LLISSVKFPPKRDTKEFIELRFKSGSWEKRGIPETGCRVRAEAFECFLSRRGEDEIQFLIYGLMDWLDVTDDPAPALTTLRQLLDRHYPPDGCGEARCYLEDEKGVSRIFHVGKVDVTGDLVAWQRRSWILALAQRAREVGRIVVSAPSPISVNVAQRILSLGLTSFMSEPFDSYAGALSCSRSTANVYSWEAGEATTCHWEYGLGKRLSSGHFVDCSDEVEPLPEEGWLSSNQLAVQVAIAGGYQ
jgi:hypothetical protein